jgi:hypothetical protein
MLRDWSVTCANVRNARLTIVRLPVVKLRLLAFVLTACGAAASSSAPTSPASPAHTSSAPTPAPHDLCAELDASLPRFAVRATATGWERVSTEPIDGVEATTLETTELRDGVAIATVGDGACGAYGECVRGVFAVCGDELVVLRRPDYVFDLRFGEGHELVETERLSGSQAGEAERMERGEPLTAEHRWRITSLGVRRIDG